MDKAKNLKELTLLLSSSRKELLSRLLLRKWFKHTDYSLQKEVLTLPDDWEGYLSDLSKRKDEIGGMEVLALSDFKRGDFVGLTRFKVRVLATNEVLNYGEYVNYKFGSNPGYRGIILLEEDGQIKHFIVKKSEKFPVGESVYESFGGTIQYKQGQLINMPKNAEKEIKRQLGLEELNIKRFIDLGQMYTDVGRASHHISLFGAIIDVTHNAEKLRLLKDKEISNTKRVSFELKIEPIERLHEYVNKVDDSFFLASVLRLVSLGIIKLN